MSVQAVERVMQETAPFIVNNQELSPSIVLVTTGLAEVKGCIENAFRIAKTGGFRLVIVLYSVSDQTAPVETGQPETIDTEAILEGLAQAAYEQGIWDVKTIQQECWGEDELDELAKLENSKCMFLAI